MEMISSPMFQILHSPEEAETANVVFTWHTQVQTPISIINLKKNGCYKVSELNGAQKARGLRVPRWKNPSQPAGLCSLTGSVPVTERGLSNTCGMSDWLGDE